MEILVQRSSARAITLRILRPVVLVIASIFVLSPSSAATVEIDPTVTLENITSLGEWNTDGDIEGWSVINLPSPLITGGVLTGTPLGSAKLTRVSVWPNLFDEVKFIELRIRQLDTYDDNTLNIFWARSGEGISATRSVSVDTTEDNLFHIYRINMTNEPLWSGTLGTFRIEPNPGFTNSNEAFELDYVRLGTVVPIPPAVLLFCSGLLGLVGMARRKAA